MDTLETYQCERCAKEEENTLRNPPDGWFHVPHNVSVFLCSECMTLVTAALLERLWKQGSVRMKDFYQCIREV
jgi:hypothetical protein